MDLGHGELAGTNGAWTWGASLNIRNYVGHMELGHWELEKTHGAGTWGASWDT